LGAADEVLPELLFMKAMLVEPVYDLAGSNTISYRAAR